MSHTEYVPMIVRRKVLESSVGGLTALVAGCTGSSTPDATDHVDDWHEDAVRGDGDPIEIERSVDESDRFETRCHWVGRERLRAVLDERLDRTENLQMHLTTESGTENLEIEETGRILVVNRVLVVDRSGSVRSTPTPAFEAVRENTPRVVNVTVDHESHERTCAVPVYIHDSIVRED